MKKIRTLKDLEYSGAVELVERTSGGNGWRLFVLDDRYYIYAWGDAQSMQIPTSDGGIMGGWTVERWDVPALRWFLSQKGIDDEEILGAR